MVDLQLLLKNKKHYRSKAVHTFLIIDSSIHVVLDKLYDKQKQKRIIVRHGKISLVYRYYYFVADPYLNPVVNVLREKTLQKSNNLRIPEA
jgi:hypothetical protein